MEFGSYAVTKVKDDPEQFWIVFADPKGEVPKGFMFQTSEPMSEKEMCAALTEMGIAQGKSWLLIEKARTVFAEQHQAVR